MPRMEQLKTEMFMTASWNEKQAQITV